MFKPARKIYNWAASKAHSTLAPLWLGIVFLFETVLVVPIDPLLMLFCLENPKKRYLYATIATLASVASGVIGFFLGYLLWDTIGPFVVKHLMSPKFFERLVHQYTEYENTAVFIGSILPIPFKAVTLSAGFCQLAIAPFILSVLAARSLRFFFIAYAMKKWGTPIKSFVDNHFNRIILLIGAKLALAFGLFWVMGQ